MYLQVLSLSLCAYYIHADTILSVCVVLFHLFLIFSWFISEPVVTWAFTTIGIIFFTIFPGFCPSLSFSLFATSILLGWRHTSYHKSLDKIEKNIDIKNIDIKNLSRKQSLININIDMQTEKFERINLIRQMSENLSGQIDINIILNIIADFTQKIIAPENLLRIYLLNDDMDSLELSVKRDINKNRSFPEQDEINRHIFRENKSILIKDSVTDKRFSNELISSPMRSNISTPLMTHDKILGIIRIDSATPNMFTISDQIFLANIANLSSLYINNAKLYHLTKKLSITDGLTGLYTHSYFKEILKNKIEQKVPFCLLLLDVDNFKKINDRYGHAVGDQVLIKVAEITQNIVSDSGIAARYGGEEFAVIKNSATIIDGLKTADILRKKISQTSISIRRNLVSVTTSIGITHYPDTTGNQDDLMRLVDNALYKAKRNGKNRVESAK